MRRRPRSNTSRPDTHRPTVSQMARPATVLLLALVLALLLAGPAVAGDLVRMNGDVEVRPGQQYDSVVVMNGDIVVRGQVDGDVFAANGDITVADGGYVGGDAVSLTGDVRTEGSGAVAGTETEGEFDFQPGDLPNVVVTPGTAGGGGFGWLFFALGVVGFGLFLVLVSATALGAVGTEVSRHTGRSALIGVVSLVGVPALFVVLCITIIGIPLALLMIPLVPLMSIYGTYAIALVAGRRIVKLLNQPNAGDLWSMVAGALLLVVLMLVPILGWLLLFVASLVGFGAAVSKLWEYARTRRTSRPAPGQAPPPYPVEPYPMGPYPVPPYPPANPVTPYVATPYPTAGYAAPGYAAPGYPAPQPSAGQIPAGPGVAPYGTAGPAAAPYEATQATQPQPAVRQDAEGPSVPPVVSYSSAYEPPQGPPAAVAAASEATTPAGAETAAPAPDVAAQAAAEPDVAEETGGPGPTGPRFHM